MTRANRPDDVGSFDEFDDDGPLIFRFGDDDEAFETAVATPLPAVTTDPGPDHDPGQAVEPDMGRDVESEVARSPEPSADDLGDDLAGGRVDLAAAMAELGMTADEPVDVAPADTDGPDVDDEDDDDFVEVWSFTAEEDDDEEPVADVALSGAGGAHADVRIDDTPTGGVDGADGVFAAVDDDDEGDDGDDGGGDDLSEVAAMLFDLRGEDPADERPEPVTTEADVTAELPAAAVAVADVPQDAATVETTAVDAGTTDPAAEDETDAEATPAAIDLANFTARGVRVGASSGGRRRRLGRLSRR